MVILIGTVWSLLPAKRRRYGGHAHTALVRKVAGRGVTVEYLAPSRYRGQQDYFLIEQFIRDFTPKN